MPNRNRTMLALLAVGLPAGPALAEGHGAKDHAHKAPHGGLVQTAGKYHFELCAGDDGVDVYLLDDKEATLPVAGKQGKLVLQIPKKPRQDLPLAPSGEVLHAHADLAGVGSFVAVVTLKLDGRSQSARFSWKRGAAPASEPPDHAAHDHGAKPGSKGKNKQDTPAPKEAAHQH